LSYFTDFPKITYLYNISGKDQLLVVRDITKNVRVKKALLSNITYYEDYDIIDGDTPERIAEKFYGDPELNWVVMLSNNKFSSTDFPLNSNQLEEYVISKYGENNRDAQHIIFGNLHFERTDGTIVEEYTASISGIGSFTLELTPNVTAVTNFEYEFKLNEDKRRIILVHPKVIPTILANLQDIINSSDW
jgi:phage antirepressor YoqD-like protein